MRGSTVGVTRSPFAQDLASELAASTLTEPRAGLDSPGFDNPGSVGTDPAGSVLTEEVTEQQVEPGDHERFSHYVRKEKIVESAVTGEPVVALCGKVWTPSRDPQRFPVCPECKKIYDGLAGGESD